ncbi:LamG domain-containing protein [Candidatus Poribacteria bacterium]|nr:LamG domain-containing protein [Candidatus Poribacteria bacterium]
MFNKMFITVLILTVITTVVCDVNVVEAQEYVTDGLIGFWTMDEEDIQGATVKDVSGKNNHGKMGSNPEIIKGKIEEALHFDGTDDFVAIPDLGNELAVSVEIWAIAEKPFPDIRGLLSTFDPPQWKAGSVHFKFEANKIDVLKNGGGRIQVPAEPNRWYHVAYTSDTKSNELKLYVDGKLINTVVAGAEPNNLTHLRIGSEHEGRYFPGILDEARLYNRALTEKEMRQNFEVKNNEMAVNAAGKLTITWGALKNLRN